MIAKHIFNSIGSNYSNAFLAVARRRARKDAPEELSKQLAALYGGGSVLLTARGLEAIVVILKSLKLPEGSKVAINGYTCYVVYDAVREAGFEPVLVDISAGSLNFNAQSFKQAAEADSTIKAVIIQNTFGELVDIVGIEEVCQQHDIAIVEDLAHCAGVAYADGRMVGSVGIGAALSFSQDKITDGIIGGAAILRGKFATVASDKLSLWRRGSLRLYPTLTRLVHATHHLVLGKIVLKSFKMLKIWPDPMYRSYGLHELPAWHAGLCLQALSEHAEKLQHRIAISNVYASILPETAQLAGSAKRPYLRFPVFMDQPEKLAAYLESMGVYTGTRWYDAPIGPKRFMQHTDYKNGQCPESERVSERILNLPTHIKISEDKAKYIASKASEWLNQNSAQ